ncbi:MAG: M23 family metallopeptidase [Deltaproteobacteria bacterium]|nr:M23 family metallopeptidase [Deltaproteobacteria bacterium]
MNTKTIDSEAAAQPICEGQATEMAPGTTGDTSATKRRLTDTQKNALIISGVALAGLFGVMVGMFVATDRTAPHTVTPEQTPVNTGWLEPVADTEGANVDAEHAIVPMASQDATPAADTEVNGAASPAADGVVPPSADMQRMALKSGQAVVTALTDLGLTAADAQLIINALDGVFDFRRARPGHMLEVRFDIVSGRPAQFKYEASKTDIYVVKLEGDTYKGRKLNILTDKTMRTFAGTITSSLFGTLKDLGARASLAGMVADILSTQVNFLKEQRPGDTFKVMVEEESLDGEYLGYGPVLALEYNGVKAGQRQLYRFQEGNQTPTYYDDKMVSTPRSALTIPLYYSRVSSPFGWRIHPILKRKKLHNGVDFTASAGTPVWACADGTVTIAGMAGANGNLVGIQHDDGLSSYYAHLIRIEKGIKNGVKVRRRQVIGYVGSTGRSTGPHLHWGVKQNGKFIDPLKYKIIPGRKVAGTYQAELRNIIRSRSAVLKNTAIEAPKGEIEAVPDGDYPMGMDDL